MPAIDAGRRARFQAVPLGGDQDGRRAQLALRPDEGRTGRRSGGNQQQGQDGRKTAESIWRTWAMLFSHAAQSWGCSEAGRREMATASFIDSRATARWSSNMGLSQGPIVLEIDWA